MKDLHSLFKITEITQHEPYYKISFCMDSNDADYIRGSVTYSPTVFENLQDIVLYALMYLGHGYSGKFGDRYDMCYGHHFIDNKHGLHFLGDVMEQEGMMCYTDWGCCHSVANIDIEYIDEQNCIHPVTLPDIDTLFETEEEMIDEIKKVYRQSSYFDEELYNEK